MLKKSLFFSNPAYLSTHLEQLVVERPDEPTLPKRTVPIEDIGVIVLDHPQITISHTVLSKLLEQNVAVVTTDAKHMPNGLLLCLNGHTLQSQRYQSQIEATQPMKKQLWAQTIKHKILNQAALLELVHQPATRLHYLASDIKSGDPENREGQAAAYYWRHLFEMADEEAVLDDESFIRERYGEAPNNLLNYGYAILRAFVARALVASGLLPTLGIHHRNQYNAYCLADDVMEPYRPFIDRMVYDLCKGGTPILLITPPLKQRLLSIATVDTLIDGQRSPLMIAVQRTAASLAKCYAGETRRILYPEFV